MRLVLATLLLASGLHAQGPALAINGLDPVLLTQGSETPGREQINIVRKGYLYRFTSSDSRGKFESDPDRFEIQMDGACGRMGPASGAGDPSRWLVHEGRIYIFASDACRRSFAADPANHIEKPEHPPVLIPSAVARGKSLWTKAVAAVGGEKALASLTTYVEETAGTPEKAGEEPTRYITRFRAPADIRIETHYPGYGEYTRIITADLAVNVSPKSVAPMREAEREAVLRDAARRPLMALLARDREDFKVWWESSGKVGDQPAEIVGVFFGGAVTRFAVHPQSGRIIAAYWRGRATPALAEIEARFSAFKPAGSLVLPYHIETWLAGKQRGARTVSLQTVNTPLDPALFTAPSR